MVCRLFAVALLLVIPPLAAPQSPSAELLKLVPDDAGLCLVITDLRGNTQKLLDARWIKTLLASPLGQGISATPEFEKLHKFNRELKASLQIDWPQFRDEILGQAVVFAWRPGAESDVKKEQGIILVRTANAKLLADLVERFQNVQKQTGELREVTPVQFKGTSYFRRLDSKGTNYYWLHDGLLAFSSQEGLIQAVVERSKADAPSRFTQQFQQAGAGTAFVTLALNPRAFDAEFDKKLVDAAEKDRHLLTVFRRYWTALDGLVLSWKQHDGNELAASFQGRTAALPAGGRAFFEQLGPSAELWDRFPDNAIVRVACRIDVAALAQALGEFAQPTERQAAIAGLQKTLGALLGLDIVDDLLPNVGPDVGLCIAPASEASKVPYALVAVKVQPGNKQVDWNLLQAVTLLGRLAMLDYNSKHTDQVVMKTRAPDGIEIKYFVNERGFPAGFEPALALKDSYLLLTTNPHVIPLFRTSGVEKGDRPLLHLSCTRLAEDLHQRRDDLARQLMEQRGVPQQLVNAALDTLASALGAFDDLTLTQRSQAGQTTWTLRLRAK